MCVIKRASRRRRSGERDTEREVIARGVDRVWIRKKEQDRGREAVSDWREGERA